MRNVKGLELELLSEAKQCEDMVEVEASKVKAEMEKENMRVKVNLFKCHFRFVV